MEVVGANVIGILIWAKCIRPQKASVEAGKAGGIDHSAEHVATFLEKFFPASLGTMDQAIMHVELAGYQMDHKADVVSQIVSGDPFKHS